MNGGKANWRRLSGVLVLAVASLGGVTHRSQALRVYTSAQQFVRYFRAIEQADAQVGFWGRVTLSLALTGTDSAEPHCSQQ